jgi:hypothetical protein
MDSKRLESMAYSEGFIENFLEGALAEDENMDAKTAEQYAEVRNAWLILSTGFKELRRDNAQMQSKINGVKIALQ